MMALMADAETHVPETLTFRLKPEERVRIQRAIEKSGYPLSLAAYVRKALEEQLRRDGV